eukprot:5748547-Prymnesium_polylepis.1
MISENAAVANSVCATKVSAHARKQSLQKEARQLASMNSLSENAGIYYKKVTSPSELLNMLRVIAGNPDGARRSCFEGTNLPHDTLSSPLHMHPTLGGTHTLSPEYCYNAKRSQALSAGLVDITTGKLLPVQEAQLEPTTYFTGSTFRSDLAARFSMSLMADPFKTNIFDMKLPRPLVDSMSSPGKTLLSAFEYVCGTGGPSGAGGSVPEGAGGAAPGTSASHPPPAEPDSGDQPGQQGQQGQPGQPGQPGQQGQPGQPGQPEQPEQPGQPIHPDTIDEEEQTIIQARRMAEDRKRVARFIRYVTQRDVHGLQAGEHTYDVLDPAVAQARRAQKDRGATATFTPVDEVAEHTNRIRDTIVMKWKDMKITAARKLPPGECEAELRRIAEDYTSMTHELIQYHMERLGAAFICREKRAKIPNGYLAWHDSLMKEVEHNGGSASLAFGEADLQMLSNDRSPLGELMGWIGGIFSDVAFIDGRQRSAMDIVFFTVFECFQDVTYYTILSGKKGLGKSQRTDHMAELFPKDTFVFAGSSSTRAGMNGTTQKNARAHVYDEMPNDMINTRDTMRQDYYKQISTKR